MATNLSSLISNIETQLGTVTALVSVTTIPLLVDEWLENYQNGGARHTACHLGIRGDTDGSAHDTDSGEREVVPFRITVIQPYNELTLSACITLRDAILDAVYTTAQLDQGGYADITNYVGFGIDESEADFAVWHIDMDCETSWERS